MTCDCTTTCTDCTETCNTCAPLTYGGVGSEIAGDIVTAITNDANVQQAILDLVGDLSGVRTCSDTADCIDGNPETIGVLTTLINSLVGDTDCEAVASCIESTDGIAALSGLVTGTNDFKTALVNLISTEADTFTCEDVADCITDNATVQEAISEVVGGIIKKGGPITWSSGTTKTVTDADVTSGSVVLSRGISSGTQAGNRTWNTSSGSILFTSTAAENVTFYYVVFI